MCEVTVRELNRQQIEQADEVFTIQARRCKRCGGLLTSARAIRDGYGACCLRKIIQEERGREENKDQMNLFGTEEEA